MDTPEEVALSEQVPLDLSEEPKSNQDLETVFQNHFAHLNMKLPIAVQNCVPTALQELVVITSSGGFLNEQKLPLSAFYQPGGSEPKRICIEQDGQTFILALQDDLYDPGSMEIPPKTFSTLDGSQLLNFEESSSRKEGINQNWFTSREEKTSLHNKGHLWKQGMWSKEEVDTLEHNIQIYCKDHEISNPATIVFEMSKDERKDFYRTIAKGLNRPLFSVYRRVIRMYDNKNHVGKYTAEELEQLRTLRATHGNDWQAIGAAMGRSASSIKDRCRLMKDNCNQGKWLPAEEERLAQAVYELTTALPGEMISSGLSWATVSERVGTRSEKQCRTKWLNYLNWKVAGGSDWTREDDLTLIFRVHNLNVPDENQIDWNELAKDWPSVRSPQWLRGKWWNLKRHVPNLNIISFQDACEYLYQHFVVRLRAKDDESVSPSSPVPPPTLVVPTTHICPPTPVVTLANGAPCVEMGPLLQTLEVLPQQATFLLQPPPQIIIQTIPAAAGEIVQQRSEAAVSTQVPSPPPLSQDQCNTLDQDSDNDETGEGRKSAHLIDSDPMLAESLDASDMESEKN